MSKIPVLLACLLGIAIGVAATASAGSSGEPPSVVGDVNCNPTGNPVNAVDALQILRHVAGLEVTQTEPCTNIGLPWATPTPSPSPSPTPSPVPTPPPVGTILYQADWSAGADGWPQALGWQWLNGKLVSDGSSNSNSVFLPAPYVPGDAVDNYAVEAGIEIYNPGANCRKAGIVARTSYRAGPYLPYGCSFWPGTAIWTSGGSESALGHFIPDAAVHVYRFEVRDAVLKLFVDGVERISVNNTLYLQGGQVGLWSGGYQMAVHSFKVVACSPSTCVGP